MTNEAPRDQENSGTAPLANVLLSDRGAGKPPRRALVASVILHVALVGAIVAGATIKPKEPPTPDFKIYRVALYSPPPQVEGPPTPPPPAPKPKIVAPPPRTESKPVPKPVPKPTPKPAPRTTNTESKPETPRRNEPATGRNAKPGAVGGEGLDVLQEGEEFPYPGYLENVITQINRYFRWQGSGRLEAEVAFYIRRDGSVSGIRVYKRSGNSSFDLAAADAANYAGKNRAFGPLPADFPRDSLGILLTFLPPR